VGPPFLFFGSLTVFDQQNKKGGPTQSRLNLTNHHYKEPAQDSVWAYFNNGVLTPQIQSSRKLRQNCSQFLNGHPL